MIPRAVLFAAVAAHAQQWIPQTSNSTASLRGVSAVNTADVWASGSGGIVLHTTDGGATWKAVNVPGAAAMDFRGIRAVDSATVYLMSSGTGDKSRIYKTSDAGLHWTLLLTNTEPKGFFDSIAFWGPRYGIVVGDAVGGHPDVRTTIDGGAHWVGRQTPPALPSEGSFAASNTCIAVLPRHEAWFVTGGPGAARVFHSRGGGRDWTAATAPIRSDSASAGIFSIAVRDAQHGVVVGGDYAKDQEDRMNVALTIDGGATWNAPPSRPHGFRSAVAWVPDMRAWIATGTSGSDISTDDGQSWQLFDSGSYNAMSFLSSQAGWAVGSNGRIARFRK